LYSQEKSIVPGIRGSVLTAWLFCALVIAASLIESISALSRSGGAGDPIVLFSEVIWNVLLILFAIPAALIITHQPRNPIGWLLMALPLAAIPVALIERHLSSFPTAPPATIPNLVMLAVSGLSWIALIFPLLLIPLFFPTGRLLSPRWRWVIYLAAGMIAIVFLWALFTETIQPEFASWRMDNPIGFIPEEGLAFFMPVWSLLLAGLTAVSLVSIAVRYRRASAVEREQMKWLLYTCFIFGLIYIPSVFLHSDESTGLLIGLFDILFVFVIGAIPAAITIAILRYHLFDISVIIRLTLVYATVTGLIGLIYAGAILLLQGLFRQVSGETSPLALVITTLAIAAMFNPLRQRVQTAIDRRFYRQKYNADQALAEFGNVARHGSDLDALGEMLIAVVSKTLQPTQVNLQIFTRINPGAGEDKYLGS
jgi:hypothetical protein